MTLQLKEWVKGLQRVGILNLLEIPHFGTSTEINACFKLLLSCVHGGFLWLYKSMSIGTQLIAQIIGLPTQGEGPFPLFMGKANEKALLERIKEKYGTYRGMCGLDVVSINDYTVRFVSQVLACKLLRKCHKHQVPARAIGTMEKCWKE
jgi:hypothetical protein